MMWSQTPDTTRPMANPEKPLTNPPTRAAQANSAKTGPSMGSLPERGDEHLDGDPSDGEAAKSPNCQKLDRQARRRSMHHHPPRLQDWIGHQADDGGRRDEKRIIDLPPKQH